MKLLLDTHILLWVAGRTARLSEIALALIEDENNQLIFSAVSILEIAIKYNLGREDFRVEPQLFRSRLLANDYQELPVTGLHAVIVSSLPPIHKDPFDRCLVAQAKAEGMTLVTADPLIARYTASVRLV